MQQTTDATHSYMCDISKWAAHDWALTIFLSGKIQPSRSKREKKRAEQQFLSLPASNGFNTTTGSLCCLRVSYRSYYAVFHSHKPIEGNRKTGQWLLHKFHCGGHLDSDDSSSDIQIRGRQEGIVTMWDKQRQLYILHQIAGHWVGEWVCMYLYLSI